MKSTGQGVVSYGESAQNEKSSLLDLKGKLAIVIPTFNSAATVAETLESIQAQGDVLQLFRCIVIADGGSTDRTLEAARKVWWSPVPMEFRLTAAGRGEALDVTDAALNLPQEVEWFFLMHSDNVAKVDWLETIAAELLFADGRIASVCSSYDSWIPGGKLTPGENDLNAPVELILGNWQTVRGTLLRGCWWHHSTAAIRIRALREVGGYLPQFRQYLDWELLLRFLEEGWNIAYVKRSLMKYREHAGSLSNSNMSYHLDIWESFKVVRKYQYCLTTLDLVHFHAIRLVYLVRRMGSAFLKGQFKRFVLAIWAASYLPFNCFICLVDRVLNRMRFPEKRVSYQTL